MYRMNVQQKISNSQSTHQHSLARTATPKQSTHQHFFTHTHQHSPHVHTNTLRTHTHTHTIKQQTHQGAPHSYKPMKHAFWRITLMCLSLSLNFAASFEPDLRLPLTRHLFNTYHLLDSGHFSSFQLTYFTSLEKLHFTLLTLSWLTHLLLTSAETLHITPAEKFLNTSAETFHH